jgi:prepilin-type N-terminal cleavage/methylation domain-containing protein
MSNKLKELRAKEGFTIIEVIIVLVIGAVIMLAVFLVVPQLQRTQRNSRRQADARAALSAVEQYRANNNGSLTGLAVSNITNAVDSKDPQTNAAYTYTINTANTSTTYDAAGKMQITTGVGCSGVTATGTGQFAVVVFQETATSYCVDIK